MILDGVMVILATTCLTVFHPGFGFQGRWNEAGFPFRTSKTKRNREDPQATVAESSENSEKVGPQVSEV